MSYNIHPLTPVEYRLRTDLGSHGDTGNEVHAKIDRLKADTTAILTDTADMQPKLGTPVTTIAGDLAVIDTVVDANQVDLDAILAELANGTYGLSALDTQLDSIEANTDTLETILGTPVVDVSADIAAIKAVADANQVDVDTVISTLGTPSNGTVSADIAAVESIVSGIQNNTRTTVAMQDEMERDDSAASYYKIILSNYDSQGNMEAPDSAPTVVAETFGGTNRSGNFFEDGDGTDTALTAGAMVNDGTGVYYVFYKVETSAVVNEGLVFEFTVIENTLTRTMTRTSRVVEEISSTFTSSDRSDLAAILADTADMQPKLGTPAADISADIAAIKSVVDAVEIDTTAIEVDTNAIQTDLGIIKNKDGGLTYDQSTDSLEAIREKLDTFLNASSSLQLVRATKTSGSIAQAASEVVVLGSTEGVTTVAVNIKEIRVVPTTQTSTNFDVEVFEDAAATLSLFKFTNAKANQDDLRIAVDLLFVNRNATPDENIYVKITNNNDASGSVFNVELRGLELTPPA